MHVYYYVYYLGTASKALQGDFEVHYTYDKDSTFDRIRTNFPNVTSSRFSVTFDERKERNGQKK